MKRKTRFETNGLTFDLVINDDGTWPNESIQSALLMDIRDELQRLNTQLYSAHGVLLGIRRKIPAVRRAKVRR